MRFFGYIAFFLLSLSCSCTRVFNPTIERTETRYYDSQIAEEVILTEFIIRNRSNDSFYTWLYPNDYESRERAIFLYYHRPNNDFSLISLINDNVVFPDDYHPIVGETFIKLLAPGDVFHYIFVGSPLSRTPDYSKQIFIEKKNQIDSVSGVIPDVLLYKLDYLVLNR